MYLESKKVAEIRKEIKKTFPTKDGFKFSVTSTHGGLSINLMKSPLFIDTVKNGSTINPYSVEDDECETTRSIFGICVKICNRIAGYHGLIGEYDHYADFQNYNYSLTMRVGKWDQECEFINE